MTPTRETSLPSILRRLHGRHSGLMVFDEDLERTSQGWSGRTVVTWAAGARLLAGPDWTSSVRHALRSLPSGGLLAGYFGYEAGRWCERMPSPSSARILPDVWLQPTEGHVCLEHATGRWTVSGSARFQAQWAAVLSDGTDDASSSAPAPQRPAPLEGPRHAYEEAVQCALKQIREGEVYQVNLAWRAAAPPLSDALSTWLDLRTSNPARRGAYLSLGDGTAILSNSPETFLDVHLDADGPWVESRPIKGTVPLAAGPSARESLAHSPKEKAELTMIVDLVRNDLGRVAPWGGVEASARTLRECGDLLHAEQVVRARLDTGRDAVDAFAAAFPPGSVTGAPKVRAMSLIHALEEHPRGVYTGAIGWLGSDGDARFNVAIRTITSTPTGCTFHLGAGIVADSDPHAEWRETLAKGRRIHQALQRAHHAP